MYGRVSSPGRGGEDARCPSDQRNLAWHTGAALSVSATHDLAPVHSSVPVLVDPKVPDTITIAGAWEELGTNDPGMHDVNLANVGVVSRKQKKRPNKSDKRNRYQLRLEQKN